MKKLLFSLILCLVFSIGVKAQLNSLGSYVWNASDEPKTFNYKLQLSFVSSSQGFPQYGTVLAGGGYSTSQDGGVFQMYFPYGESWGGKAPKIRLGKYNNQGWSNWETFYTSANANKSSIDWNAKTLFANDRIGVGTSDVSNPITIQKVSGGVGYGNSDGTGGLRIRWSTGYGVVLDAWDGGSPRWGITKFVLNTPTVLIEGRYNSNDVIFNSEGNVRIGTTNPQTKLAVNGEITTKEVIVTMDGWSDFVFEPAYKLIPLENLEQFIKRNKHLPDVPSADEVKENGLSLGKSDAILLQKVEELTLYIIEQNKKIQNLAKEIENLKSTNK